MKIKKNELVEACSNANDLHNFIVCRKQNGQNKIGGESKN